MTTETGPTEHERYVAGAVLINPNVLDDVLEVVTPDQFFDPRLAAVVDAAARLRDEGSPVEPVSVSAELARSGNLTRVGGTAALFALASPDVVPASAVWHAERVRDAAACRALWRAGTRLAELGSQGLSSEDDVLAAVDQARGELDKLTATGAVEESHRDAVFASLDSLDDPPGDPTPWSSLTKAISGFKPGALYLVGARPSVGKSIAATMTAVDMARRGKAAVLVSLEMPKRDIYHRMLIRAAQVDMGRLQNRTLTREDREALDRAAADIAELPLTVIDQDQITVAQIKARVRAEQRRRTVGIVVVDYLGLVSAPASLSRQDRRVQVDSVSRDLKRMAMALDVPVMALAQLNRGVENRASGMPGLSDFRESGGQEQDADVAILLHRDLGDPEASSTMHMILAKNRHGPLARFEFAFRGHHSSFDDMPEW